MISFEEWCKNRGYSLERRSEKYKTVYSRSANGIYINIGDLLYKRKKEGYDIENGTLSISYNGILKVCADWVEPEDEYNKRIDDYRELYNLQIKEAKELLGIE